MKKKSRNYLIIGGSVIILVLIATLIVGIFNDETRLTTLEKEWITENETAVININAFNNIDIAGDSGSGIIYDFIEDFQNEYNLELNPLTYNANELVPEVGFSIKDHISQDDLIFYEGHYVIIGKNVVTPEDINYFKGNNIGAVYNDITRVSDYAGDTFTTVSFTSFQEMLADFNSPESTINYMIIPQEQYLNEILNNELQIVYHLSDLKNYYVYSMPEEEELFSNIIYRFYLEWQNDSLEESTKTNTLNAFTQGLNISTKEIAEIQSTEHNYGFINNKPYDVLTGGNYAGIISEYLRNFSNMSNIDFKFIKYDNVDDLKKSINANELNLYSDFYQFTSEFDKSIINNQQEFVIVSSNENKEVFNHINGLNNQTVYVLKDSLIYKELKNNGNINIITYDSEKALEKAIKEENYIAIDLENYQYYKDNILKNHTIRYQQNLNDNYSIAVKDSAAFTKLFTSYMMTLDYEQIKTQGIYSNEVTVENSNTLVNIAKYTLLTFAILVLIAYYVYKSSKKINITRKIRKDEKVKFIDQLTSLKNRNYLSEHIPNWNKNTIYPQATIVIDLNKLQNINDTLGYDHGDKQIKAAANILIKTQLDNSEIIRTDGNEYLVYLVGYSDRQIVSYIRKLQKEFKTLPYEHGAAIGYSMITDDIKTIEDAVNESVEDMKSKKDHHEEEDK